MQSEIRRLPAIVLGWGVVLCLLLGPVRAEAMDLVKDGQAAVVIVVDLSPQPDPAGDREQKGWDDQKAADVLMEWIKKITDVQLKQSEAPEAGKAAIYVGRAAVKAGLNIADIPSPTHEAVRITSDGERILLSGQNGLSTVKAACRFLEELGCRYYMDHPMGEVYPRTQTLSVGKLDITEKPGMYQRSIWGSAWSGMTLWKAWNGAGGVNFSVGHAWTGIVPPSVFDEHPEYFAEHNLKVGGPTRQNNEWLCTSNLGLRNLFAGNVIKKIDAGERNPSISPPDGGSYCECPQCVAQDDPKSLEISGMVSKTNRYVDFYDYVANKVGAKHPDSILCFYAYANYTNPPTLGRKLAPNLAAWVAPIRYCWLHGLGCDQCASSQGLKTVLTNWSQSVSKIGFRTYSYNYGEMLAPFSKISVYKHDVPYLKQIGCIGINNETLPSWEIMGPHVYLFLRLAYNPDANADAIMDDYFAGFYGKNAGPAMKKYWMAIDKAWVDYKCDPKGTSRGFPVLPAVFTPELLSQCQGFIDQATAATKDDPANAARVAMTAEGLTNAQQYMQLHAAKEKGQFGEAKAIYDKLISRNEKLVNERIANPYSLTYPERFLGVEVISQAAAAAPNKVLAELPDEWRYQWDVKDEGATEGYDKAGFDEAAWTVIPTYSESMTGSGRLKSPTGREGSSVWFRNRFTLAGKPQGKVTMLFVALTETTTVYVNGQKVSDSESRGNAYFERPTFEVDITHALRDGENVIALRQKQTYGKLTEKPVAIIQKGQ